MSGIFDLEATARKIKEMDVDLIGLQEIDKLNSRHNVDEPKILSELTGMSEYHFQSFRDYEGGEYGLLILSKMKFKRFEILRYKGKSSAECAVPRENDWCQGAIALEFENLWFITTHLGIGRGVEIQSLESIFLCDWIEKVIKPSGGIIVTGDFNSNPSSFTYHNMTKYYADNWKKCGKGNGYTFPSNIPSERIDYLFGIETECMNAKVVSTEVSDHRPLLVEFSKIGQKD